MDNMYVVILDFIGLKKMLETDRMPLHFECGTEEKILFNKIIIGAFLLDRLLDKKISN